MAFHIKRLLRLVEVALPPHVSLLGFPQLCVPHCYNGNTFLRTLVDVCCPIVGLSVLVELVCLFWMTFSLTGVADSSVLTNGFLNQRYLKSLISSVEASIFPAVLSIC